MSMTAEIQAEYSLNAGQTWWPVATFEIGTARRFALALQGAGLKERGLPEDVFESFQDRYAARLAAYPQEIFGATWFSSAELSKLMDARLWLSAEDLERVPPHAYDGYTETDTVAAWSAFAQVHETNGHPVRFVVWFEW